MTTNIQFKAISLNVRGIRTFEKRKTIYNWSTSRSSFRTHAASNPSFRTKTALIVLSDLRSFTKLAAGTAMIFILEKTKRRLHDRKTEHFKALTKSDHLSAIANHIITTGHINIKWDHFDILASGKTDLHCKIKETLFIQERQPSLNASVGSERLLLY